MRQLAASVAVLASLLATACLHKDTSSTIWLKGDGSLEWIVIEHNVGSDLEGAGRQEEERQYLEDAANAASGAAESFRALGAQAVRGRLLRDVRPYASVTEADFGSLTDVVARELAACGIPFGGGLTSEGGTTTWRLWLEAGAGGEGLQGDDCGAGFVGLGEALEATIVLDSGVFTKTVGFTLEGDNRARLDEKAADPEALERGGGRIELSLTWRQDLPR